MSVTGNGSDAARLRAAIKPRDAWWAHFVIGPLANRVVGRIAPVPWVTPNRLTLASLGVGLLAAALFAVGSWPALAVGGVLLQASFLLDCMDGQLSRFRETSSLFGSILDRTTDRVKLFGVTFGLAYGAFRIEQESLAFVLAFVYFFAEYMLELYIRAYRQLAAGAVTSAAPPSAAIRGTRQGLRLLDVPIIRLAFADRYFLVSVLTIAGHARLLLWLLAGIGLVQVVLRPVYYALHLRCDLGHWPWQDERRHTLAERTVEPPEP